MSPRRGTPYKLSTGGGVAATTNRRAASEAVAASMDAVASSRMFENAGSIDGEDAADAERAVNDTEIKTEEAATAQS